MFYIKKLITLLLIIPLLGNDGQGPLFTVIMPTSDLFEGDSFTIEVQASDQDNIQEIILYYKFFEDENYKNITMDYNLNYYITIPDFEVKSTQIKYYFLGIDEFGNKTKYPDNGENNPIVYPEVFKSINSLEAANDYEINMITPKQKIKTENVPIIMLSLYNQYKQIPKEDIQLIFNNISEKNSSIVDITDESNITNELITYIPNQKLGEGIYELKINLINNNRIYYTKEFSFEVKPAEYIVDSSWQQWIQKINYSGNFSYSTDYDKFNYQDNNIIQPDSRPIDVHRFNINFKAQYGHFNLQSSILFNTYLIDDNARISKKEQQPIDRIKLGIKFPYGFFNFGDYSTTFSDFTLKGTRVRGVHSLIELGIFKIIYVRGKTKELIQSEHRDWKPNNNSSLSGITLNDGTFIYYKKGIPSRNLRGLRAELSLGGKLNFGLSALTAYDLEDVDIPYDELYTNYLFIGNSVIGSDATLFFNNKRTWIKAETAISITNNIMEENINNYLKNDLNMDLTENQQWAIGALEDLLGYSITTDLLLAKGDGRGLSIPNPIDTTNNQIIINSDYLGRIIKEGTYKLKFKTPYSFSKEWEQYIQFNLQGEYKRIPFSFVSLGNPSVPKDVQGLSYDLRTKLLNNKIIISLGYNLETDNVSQYKISTTTTRANNIGASLNFNNWPSLNYSQKSTFRKDDTNLINNSTISHTIVPTYKFSIKNTKIGINTNLVIMNYYDFQPNDINNDFRQLSVSNSLSVSANKLSFTIGSGYSNNKPENIEKFETSFSAISSKISYKTKNNKWNYYLGFNKISGENIDPENQIDNDKISIKIGSQFKLNKNSTLKYNIEHLSYLDQVDANNNYSELKAKLAFKFTF